MTRRMRHRPPILIPLLIMVVVLRGMIAPGFMPGGGGWPVQLCPDGLSPDIVALITAPDAANTHDHGIVDDGSTSGHESWALERCALGAALAQAALPVIGISLAAVSNPLEFHRARLSRVIARPASAPRARGPPVLRIPV
ncbi:MAG: hypothetical protein LC637_01675 [Xanthomonadaceae bacterium]|nr:hypothetical protein [Xanthomonadaceae bacterium]